MGGLLGVGASTVGDLSGPAGWTAAIGEPCAASGNGDAWPNFYYVAFNVSEILFSQSFLSFPEIHTYRRKEHDFPGLDQASTPG